MDTRLEFCLRLVAGVTQSLAEHFKAWWIDKEEVGLKRFLVHVQSTVHINIDDWNETSCLDFFKSRESQTILESIGTAVHVQKVVSRRVLRNQINQKYEVGTYRFERFDILVDEGVLLFAAFVRGEALGHLEKISIFVNDLLDEGLFADA